MGLTQTHGLGRDRKFFVKTEGTAGTFAKPITTDAARIINAQFDHQIERKDRIDARGTRSSVDGSERITGKGTVSWSCESYLIGPADAANEAPLHELFYAACGTYADAAQSQSYSPGDSQTLRTVSITQNINDIMQEAIWGAWVNTMTINASGGDEPRVSFDGGAMGYAFTGNTTLDAATSGSDGDFQVQPGETRAISVNSVVKVGSDDNSAAGFQVDSVNHTTYVHTCTGDTISVQADDSAVIPFVPTPDYSADGAPVAGITGSLSIGGTEFPITAFDFTVANNVKPLDDEAFQQYPDDIIPGFREVTGNIGIRARKDHVLQLGLRESFSTQSVVVVFGSGTDGTWTLTIPQTEFMFAAATFPEAEEGTISLPFKALATTTSAIDEFTLVFS